MVFLVNFKALKFIIIVPNGLLRCFPNGLLVDPVDLGLVGGFHSCQW